MHQVSFATAVVVAAAGCSPQPGQAAQATKVDAVASELLDLEVRLDGEQVPVYVFRPTPPEPAPIAVVVHGFTRSRDDMKGWGEALAEAGFVAAVPSLPSGLAIDHEHNGRIVGELVEWLGAESHSDLRGRVDDKRAGLMGFSAGGLAVVLAAARQPEVGLVVTLDGVDRGGMGKQAAESIDVPVIALWAEPGPCNADGNGHAMVATAEGPRREARIVDATHCDPEWPTDIGCHLLCGAPDPTRQSLFREHAVRAFEVVLGCVQDDAWGSGTTLLETKGLADVVVEGELPAHVACASEKRAQASLAPGSGTPQE